MFIADHWQSFEVLDTGDGEKLAAALDKARDMVLAGVLADSLTLTDTAGGEAVKEWDINGESAVIGVKRV